MQLSNFEPGKYPVIIRIISKHLVVSSPDFGMHITKRFDEIRRAEEIGSLVLDMMKKIQVEGSKRTSLGLRLPEPSMLAELAPKDDPAHLTVADVARILETSQDTVRRLVDDGSLKCSTTRGGHRRFRASVVENYRSLSVENSIFQSPSPLIEPQQRISGK